MLSPIPPEYIPNHIPDPCYVRVFDTTLHDGEQSPGATMTSKEKLVVARQLSLLGVDIIEAGFPASSHDLDAVRSIAMEVGNQPVSEGGHIPVICGLARCNKKDIDVAWEAVRHAKKSRVHTFIATVRSPPVKIHSAASPLKIHTASPLLPEPPCPLP